MPRRRLYTLFLFAACLLPSAVQQAGARGIPGGVHHPPKREARDQIMDLEQQWRTATLASDTIAMDKLLSDDYVGISWTGQVSTKQLQLDRLRTRSLKITRMDLSDTKIRVVGAAAIVTAKADIEGSNDGSDMRGAFLYTRIYTRLPSGTWKITNFEATRVPNPNRVRPGRGGPPPADAPLGAPPSGAPPAGAPPAGSPPPGPPPSSH